MLRLARRDGDEWVRLFASLLGPFPDFQRVSSDLVTEEQLEGLAEELEGACEWCMGCEEWVWVCEDHSGSPFNGDLPTDIGTQVSSKVLLLPTAKRKFFNLRTSLSLVFNSF